MTLTTIGIVCLFLCVLGIIASVAFGLPSWRSYWRNVISSQRETRELPGVISHDHLEALKIDRVLDDLAALDRKVHYRHNVHCPKCGRFSRLIDGLPGAVDCHVHGMLGSTPTMVIEIVPAPHTVEIELPLAEMLKLS